VLGYGSEDEGGGFFIETILFGEGHHQLGEDFVGHDCFGEVFGVGGETTKGEGGGLLN
jgi:hypothetical protein